ncbi:M48 family metalloprotease [Methylibium sp.]|uniref:M48 family metalloprotease n=1 Tax=Methylibium sp. TaxID=2067992 RepID=UPI00184FB539|nr:M48 family metalloprotease [Methylibium sp.]MBA3590218.1 M48 family metalloprotease [Methylibium sp.]
MRAAVLGSTLVLSLCFAAPTWGGESIEQVLERSQQMQFDSLAAQQVHADSREARIVEASFEHLLTKVGTPVAVRLMVVRGPMLAVCLLGRIVVANASLADMSESERQFILAHELGHVSHGHWNQLSSLYQKYIPDEVVQQKTDAVAGPLGREASQLAHDQEYEADAFAHDVLHRMGQPTDTAELLFRRLPMVKRTATHPGTHDRLAHIRSLQARDNHPMAAR